MKFSVDTDWWKNIFDEIYLLTDARTVCDNELTRKEVDFITTFMNPEKNSAILDLCGGQGRHSLELARRGFKDLTVLDYSNFLLRMGVEKANEKGLSIQFIQSDARFTHLPDDRFHYIILMASSFGYFEEDDENLKILAEAFRLLSPSGQLMLDIPDRDYIIANFKPSSFHRVNDDISVERHRRIKGNVIYSKETVLSDKKGCIRENTYCMRLYSMDDLKRLLLKEGFNKVSFKKDFMNRSDQGDFGCMTNRMVAIAEKPAD
jgi:D-alanine-D-alanine ligase